MAIKTKYKYEMTKSGKDKNGKAFKKVTCVNKTQKAAFQKYGFKSNPIGLAKDIDRDGLLDILALQQGGKVTPEQLKMSVEELKQEI